ncbi:MAG: MBL fold metallo-hydrolase [Saprospiraceae bacterium]
MRIQLQTPQLTIFESALFRTTSTVIQTDDFILIVDPNWLPIEIQTIRDYVDSIKGNKPIYLFFTHSDYDHIIGYNAFPEAKTIASKAFVENQDKAKILQQINNFDDENYVKRAYKIVYPTIDFVINNDSEILKIGNTKLQFFNAFGHNADGLFLWIEKLGILVVGDYLSNIEFPYIYHSGTLYLQTLQVVEQLIKTQKINYLITGHGDYTAEKKEMKQRIADSYEYIFLLINSIKSGQKFNLNWLWQRYDFPKVMTRFHEGNLKILRKEL